MKTEFLRALGLTDEQVAEVMKENGKDVEKAKAKFSEYDNLKKQLSDANATIKSYTDMDIDGIKQAAKDWEARAAKAEQDATAKIAEMEFSALLDGAIGAAKGKNAKAVQALLDLDALRGSKNQSEAIRAALEAVKKDNGYLFDDTPAPPPYAPGTGTARIDQIAKEAYTKMGCR